MAQRRDYQAPELTDFGPIGKVTQQVGDIVSELHSGVIDPIVAELEEL